MIIVDMLNVIMFGAAMLNVTMFGAAMLKVVVPAKSTC